MLRSRYADIRFYFLRNLTLICTGILAIQRPLVLYSKHNTWNFFTSFLDRTHDGLEHQNGVFSVMDGPWHTNRQEFFKIVWRLIVVIDVNWT